MTYDPQLNIVLFQPEIPYNTGSVGRTCVAIGAKLWLVHPLGFRVDDYYLRRAGLDYWQHLQWEAVRDWQDLLQRLSKRNMWFFSKKARRLYTTADFRPHDVMVFGPESNGLPSYIVNDSKSRALRIPVRKEVRSLNLSNSVAIATYEALRQWQVAGSFLNR